MDSLGRSPTRKNSFGTWAIMENHTTKIVGIIMISQLPDENRMLTADLEIG